ncbi:peptide chain release factor N(5)-glutamine methyltransferase [Geobacter pickeringii]|uniref:Release factor glutamine methyltransferase n=1 Tax=Geobacter pickeringii TaxID=345632 RepID=A0A0B5BCT3_9BACT|nr:peptide chain release factor N(5)-glutamine methyltransferase [Geobacter pickeringii]AJE02345.1 SAM-dependent methyltransferase [Geobacter pickeringii]
MSEVWTIRRVLEWTREYLAEKGIENARLETEWLLGTALGLDRVGLYVNFDKPLNQNELGTIRGLVARRAKREPLQYILGSQEFFGLDFEVTPAVLIPRHDTEVLVEEALKRAPAAGSILDIGVGSGCIAVSLAKSLPETAVWGVDRSAAALALARRNVERHGVRVTLVEGSLFEPLTGERFDMIVSNPPYIPTADIGTLQAEVRDAEPLMALDGGVDGLDFYRLIVSGASGHLAPRGWLMVEVGIGQAEAVLGMFTRAGFGDCFTAKDPNGIDRVVGGRIP